MLSRSRIVGVAAVVAIAGAAFAVASPRAVSGRASAKPQITVYKSPTCGCCGVWVTYLRNEGFDVTVREVNDVSPIKNKHAVPSELWACHTALVDGYVIEGHVTASAIERLLKERPPITGLAVPGMPQGSPGMGSLSPTQYNVVAFDAQGQTTVYEKD